MKVGARIGLITKGIVAVGATTVALLMVATPAQAATMREYIGHPQSTEQKARAELRPMILKCRNAGGIPKRDRVNRVDNTRGGMTYQAFLECHFR